MSCMGHDSDQCISVPITQDTKHAHWIQKNLQQNNNIWYHSLLCLMSAYEINVKSLWNTWKHFMKYLSKPSQTSRKLLGWKDATQKKTHTHLLNQEHVPLVGNCGMQSYLLVSCPICSLWSIKNQQARSTLVGSLHGLSDYLTHCDTTTASPSFAMFSVLTWAKQMSVEYKRKKVAQHLITRSHKCIWQSGPSWYMGLGTTT